MREQIVRYRIYVALFLLVLLVTYWPTVFHEYGFRDDYSHLRETREIPEHLIRFTASYGRPIYGPLLVASVRPLDGQVANLEWVRLGAVFLLALVSMVLMRLLQRAGWSTFESAAVGLSIGLLPAAQMTVGWSIAWPLALALLLVLGGFAATDAALARTGWPRLGAWAAGFFAYLVAGLIYQPSALFFVVPLAAALLLKSDAARARLAWCAAHLATGLGGLATGFVAMRMVFALGWLKQATVFGLETDPLAKLVWFVSGPVANSLGLFALRDRFDTPLAFWVAVVLVTALIAAGFLWRVNREPIDKWTALFCLFVLPFVAFAVNLAAALRVPSYRTTYGLAGLVVVFIVYALGSLRAGGRLSRSAHYAALSLMLVIGAVAANRHAYTLIAEPQGWEWQIMLDAASRFEPGMKVYVIHSSTANRATQRTFADEFGSLSSDTDWAVEAMFNCALRRRFPSGVPASTYTLRAGPEAPPGGTFDLVIDMRKLRQHRAD
ncbi:MAG: hypothetical protein ACREUX_19005 [Burkholderiales bacterium]